MPRHDEITGLTSLVRTEAQAGVLLYSRTINNKSLTFAMHFRVLPPRMLRGEPEPEGLAAASHRSPKPRQALRRPVTRTHDRHARWHANTGTHADTLIPTPTLTPPRTLNARSESDHQDGGQPERFYTPRGFPRGAELRAGDGATMTRKSGTCTVLRC